ncbi:hypothetical protein [Haloarcula nitratireducens]|uniref:Uncharacterized protein n=1 Tax=Haloarcula nitratireducens TaxID=2487749 RepID=A0AAW4PGC0_9EURY|nr:hypothetical protein [Halomicroarcula nitratireducens]MBX0297024.1 hypothetical protein [Halomicroarcula nitratireducens]
MHWREALTTYAMRHEAHCRAFARATLQRADRDALLSRTGPTKREFIDYLEAGLVERDFKNLF